MSETTELRPKPVQVKRKPKGVRLKDLEPAAGQYHTALTEKGATKCSGILHGGSVLVTQLQHIWALVKLGCYGKGVFSRSVPCHQHMPSRAEVEQVSRKRTASAAYGEEIELSWRKRLKLHTQWKRESSGTAKGGTVGIVEGEEVTGEGMRATASIALGRLVSGDSIAQGEGISCREDATGMVLYEALTGVTKEGNCRIKEEDTEFNHRTEGGNRLSEGGGGGMEGNHRTGVCEGEKGTEEEKTTGAAREGRTKDKGANDYLQFISRLKAVRMEDPYSIEEYLQLGPEEAFYLASEVGVLTVETDKAVALNTSDLWLHLTSLSKSFCSRYAAYSHYRAGNWVPKSGLKFGVDFLLYKESPLSYHSCFAVTVKEVGGSEGASLTWKEVIALNRVSESAKKDLLVCNVTWPEGTARGEPNCIDGASVTDILVKWWVPEKDR